MEDLLQLIQVNENDRCQIGAKLFESVFGSSVGEPIPGGMSVFKNGLLIKKKLYFLPLYFFKMLDVLFYQLVHSPQRFDARYKFTYSIRIQRVWGRRLFNFIAT